MDSSSSDSGPPGGPEAQDLSKIAYVAQACIFCKKRHLKCDGMTPCVQCRLRTQECVYEGSKKRGRKPNQDTKEPSAGASVPATPSSHDLNATADLETPRSRRASQGSNYYSSGKRGYSQVDSPADAEAPAPKRHKASEQSSGGKSSRAKEPKLQFSSLSQSNDSLSMMAASASMDGGQRKAASEGDTRQHYSKRNTRQNNSGSTQKYSTPPSTSSSASSSSSSGASSPMHDPNNMSREALLALVERQREALNEAGLPSPHSFPTVPNSGAKHSQHPNMPQARAASNQKGSNNNIPAKDLRTAPDDTSDSGFDDNSNVNSSSNSSDENVHAEMKSKRKRVLYADVGVNSSTLMTVFINRNSFLFPTGRPPVDAAAASDYFNAFKSRSAFKALLKSDINTLTEAFSYGVAFALGAKAIAKWGLVKDFIFHTNNKILERILKKEIGTQPNSSLFLVRVLSGVCFHIMLHLACADLPEARTCALLAFNLMNQYQSLVIKTLQYTVYTHMASLCTRPQEKLHWLDCAEKLGPGSAPPVNQVILAVFVTGEILSKNEQLFPAEHFTEKTTAQDFEYRLKIHQYCAAALDSIDHHPAFSHGRNVLMAATLKMMVSGCRSLAALQIGKHDEALAWASTTIQVVKYVDTTILPMLITISLAYAVHVAAVMQQRDLFSLGMARLKQFAGLYPIAVTLWNRLVQQGQVLAADATFIVALPEYGSAAFNQYQQQIQNAANLAMNSHGGNSSGSSTHSGVSPRSGNSSGASSGGVSTSPSDDSPKGNSPNTSSTSSSTSSGNNSGSGNSGGMGLSPMQQQSPMAGFPSMFASSPNFSNPMSMPPMGSSPSSASSRQSGSEGSPPLNGISNSSGFSPFDSSGLGGFGASPGSGPGLNPSMSLSASGSYPASSPYQMMSDMYSNGQHHDVMTHQMHSQLMNNQAGSPSDPGVSPQMRAFQQQQGFSPFGMQNAMGAQGDLIDNVKTSPEFASGYDDAGM